MEKPERQPEFSETPPPAFPLTEIYDRIVNEGGYFEYDTFADRVSALLPSRSEILELCVGTGNLALELEKLQFSVVGIDNDEAMLRIGRQKTDAISAISLEQGRAENFELNHLFDAVVLHSGHLIINRNESGLFLNAESPDSINDTFSAVANHLKPSGHLIINIEDWTDFSYQFEDGSIYQRDILEETSQYGTRLHVFYDRPNDRLHKQAIVRQAKIPLQAVQERLAGFGFSGFTVEPLIFHCTAR